MTAQLALEQKIKSAIDAYYFETGLLITEINCKIDYRDSGHTSNQGYADMIVSKMKTSAVHDLGHKGRHLCNNR